MIVVSTYNDISILTNFLNSLKNTINLDEKILIVCSCPKQIKMIQFLTEIKHNNNFDLNFDFTVTPYSGYDTGSFIWAYNNFKDDYYIFLQDSLIINNPNWLSKFKEFRSENTLNTWCSFPINDENEHTNFFFSKMGFIPKSLNGYIGVFGPIFQISRQSLDMINKTFNINKFIPNDKTSACAMERGWTYLAINSNLSINCIDGEYSRNLINYKVKNFIKIFNNRE